MYRAIVSLCCFILCFGILPAQDMGKTKETEKNGMIKKEEMKHGGMKKHKMKKEMACDHCTKDKKCEMHEKEMACPHCSKDKKCEMHANEDMHKADSTKK